MTFRRLRADGVDKQLARVIDEGLHPPPEVAVRLKDLPPVSRILAGDNPVIYCSQAMLLQLFLHGRNGISSGMVIPDGPGVGLAQLLTRV